MKANSGSVLSSWCSSSVSETSKKDLLHFFAIDPAKIEVVYNAIDERLWDPPAEEEVARRVATGYGGAESVQQARAAEIGVRTASKFP